MFTMGKNHKLHLLLLYLMVFRLEETHLRFILSQGKPLMGFCRTGILLYLLENTTEYFFKKISFFYYFTFYNLDQYIFHLFIHNSEMLSSWITSGVNDHFFCRWEAIGNLSSKNLDHCQCFSEYVPECIDSIDNGFIFFSN